MNKRIIITGFGKLAQEFDKINEDNRFIILPKKTLDITNYDDVDNILKHLSKHEFGYLIHTAAVCKPMSKIDENPILGIDNNIIGTANIAKACYKYGIKLIYISTDAVYPSKNPFEKWHNSEESPTKPQNKYAWSKLGGECVVQLIPNSLILRCALTDIPFKHKDAWDNVYKCSITHKEAVKLILQLIDEEGIINIGGPCRTIYEFVKDQQSDIKKGWANKSNNLHLRINLNKLNSLIK